ncbi:hypothetical protein THOG11_50057 [Vibrio harveyi]|uniref:Uncharacterized protein n=1 Tax=Vibrio owensii TaxID=696485 RepID=A0AAU9Q4T3_9VIBR|nr:hypothetical protein THF1D04_20409 [Vibrio owensii]CAH1579345.1 hypothetical protein THOG11_50057 [Vibrio harveyi]CAH1527539.1 hypothetical protein THZG08_30005 [Vibrio owensii]CAH1554097.1 hypothetical protein THZB04_10503 [Vibrio owensii]CAH1567365.1 hypothetical protein THOA03_30005 [Vibrio owensii]
MIKATFFIEDSILNGIKKAN